MILGIVAIAVFLLIVFLLTPLLDPNDMSWKERQTWLTDPEEAHQQNRVKNGLPRDPSQRLKPVESETP